MQRTDMVAAAMAAAWERIKLGEKQAAMAEMEREAFAALARQSGRSSEQKRGRVSFCGSQPSRTE
jgi:hypothetical protein